MKLQLARLIQRLQLTQLFLQLSDGLSVGLNDGLKALQACPEGALALGQRGQKLALEGLPLRL